MKAIFYDKLRLFHDGEEIPIVHAEVRHHVSAYPRFFDLSLVAQPFDPAATLIPMGKKVPRRNVEANCR